MKLLSAPHRLFFFLGGLNAIISMILFLLGWTGAIFLTLSVVEFHPFFMIYTLFPFFIFGFLLTIFPRFLALPEVKDLSGVGAIALIALLALWGGLLWSVSLLAIGMLLLLALYCFVFFVLFRYQRQTLIQDKNDTKMILIAQSLGIAGLLFYTLGMVTCTSLFYQISLYIGIHFYLILLFFTILQRMLPFFSSAVEGYKSHRPRSITLILALGMTLHALGVITTLPLISSLGISLQVGAVLWLLSQWKLPYDKAPPILFILYVGVLWFVYARGVEAVLLFLTFFGFELPSLAIHHGVYIGFLGSLLIGFVSRVTRGHGGQPILADGFTKLFFITFSLLAVLRIGCDILIASESELYTQAIFLLALLWTLTLTTWGAIYGRWLIR